MRLLPLSLALLAFSSAQAAPAPRACLVQVSTEVRDATAPAISRALEAELRRQLSLIPGKSVARTGKSLKLNKDAWSRTPGLERLAKALRCSPLRATLSAGLGGFVLSMAVLDPATATPRVEVALLLRRAVPSADEARQLTARLVTRLRELGDSPADSEGPSSSDMPQASEVPPAGAAADTSRGALSSNGTAPTPTSMGPSAATSPPSAAAAQEADPWDAAAEGFEPATPTQAAAPTTSPAHSNSNDALQLSGRVKVDHFAFSSSGPTGLESGRASLEAALRVKASHERVKACASLLGRIDFADPARNRFEPDEAWVEVNAPHLTVRAGRAIVSWGAATLYNPSDVVNAVDLSDPLVPEKLGTLQLRAVAGLGDVTLEALFLPVPELHRLPVISGITPDGTLVSSSRWLRGSVDVSGTGPLRFHVSPYSAPAVTLANGQAAARVGASLLGADVSVGYAFLLDRFPSPSLEAVPATGVPLGVDVFVDWRSRRLHVFTADAERTFGKLRIALEGAAFLTTDRAATATNVADPYWIAVAGGDYQTPEFWGEQRAHFFLEVAIARTFAGELPKEGLDRLRVPFPETVLARVAWDFTDDLRLEMNVVTSIERFDVLLSPRFEARLFDRLKARIGADILLGDATEGYFGPFRDNSRGLATVEVNF